MWCDHRGLLRQGGQVGAVQRAKVGLPPCCPLPPPYFHSEATEKSDRGISTPSYSFSIIPTSLCAATTKPSAWWRALSSAGRQPGRQGGVQRGRGRGRGGAGARQQGSRRRSDWVQQHSQPASQSPQAHNRSCKALPATLQCTRRHFCSVLLRILGSAAPTRLPDARQEVLACGQRHHARLDARPHHPRVYLGQGAVIGVRHGVLRGSRRAQSQGREGREVGGALRHGPANGSGGWQQPNDTALPSTARLRFIATPAHAASGRTP